MTDEFIQPLLAWYDENKRILPWRDKDVYKRQLMQLRPLQQALRLIISLPRHL